MALQASNISTQLIKDVLGANTNAISQLCNNSSINKWSKYKPVVGTWPQADGSYGLVKGTWTYTPPSTNCNLSNFAGYEHDINIAEPPLFSKSSQNTINNLYPNTAGYQVDNYWRINVRKSDSSIRLTPADLGLTNYYYGFKVACTGGTYYKTIGTISSFGSAQEDTSSLTSITATLQNPTSSPSYYNLPYGTNGDGTYTWTLIVCSSISSSWSTVVPGEVYNLPSSDLQGSVYTSSFTLYNWNHATSSDVGQFNAAGNGEKSFDVYTNNSIFTLTNDVSSWITAQVYKDGNYVSNINNYQTDSSVRLTCSANYGSARSGKIFIGTGNASVGISVSQAAASSGVTYVWNENSGQAGDPSYYITPNSHGMSIGSANFDLNFDHGFSGDEYKNWSISATPSGASASGSGNPNGVRLRTGVTAVKTGTLDANIADGDTVSILIDFIA